MESLDKQSNAGKFSFTNKIFRIKKINYLFALKKIFKSIIDEYKMQDQLLIELKILSQINHPNIVKAYQSFTDDYHYFILMEYV